MNPIATQHNRRLERIRILITGGYGQLGSELRAAFADDYVDLTVVDRDTLDITDRDAVMALKANKAFEYIINCAAYTAVDRAESETESARRINVEGVANLAEVARDTGARLVHVSTDFVFDGENNRPYREDDLASPLSVYGATKLESEHVAAKVATDAVIVRTGWLYSSYGHNFVKTILSRVLAGSALTVVDDQRGTPTYAADLAQALRHIVLSSQWHPGVYHYSNMGETTWFGFARQIAAETGIDAVISPCATADYPTAARRPAYSVLDKSKIIKTYHLTIPQWQDSLRRCMAILNSNQITPNG